MEALGAGIAGQLAVLDDASLTGTGQSSADVLGVSGAVVAGVLTGHLLREILTGGAGGGPLFPLASQLNDDVTHLQGQRLEGMLGQLADDVRQALAQLDATRAVASGADRAGAAACGDLGVHRPGRRAGGAGRAAEPGGPSGGGAGVGGGRAGRGGQDLPGRRRRAAAVRRGWFGGGVLFVDLHGYDETPVEAGQALDALLRGLGVAAEHILPTTEERAALYRSALAQIPEPVLVIADNASAEAQIRPLLPGAGPHTVLVTSRHTLARLGARLVDVTVLDEDASVALLDAALRTARPGDERISAARPRPGGWRSCAEGCRCCWPRTWTGGASSTTCWP